MKVLLPVAEITKKIKPRFLRRKLSARLECLSCPEPGQHRGRGVMCRAKPSGGINTRSQILLLCSDYFKAFGFNIHSCSSTWPQRRPMRCLPLSGALRVDCDWRELEEEFYLWMYREKGEKRRENRSLWWALTHTQPLCSPDWGAAGHLSPSHTGSQAAVFSCLRKMTEYWPEGLRTEDAVHCMRCEAHWGNVIVTFLALEKQHWPDVTTVNIISQNQKCRFHL